MVKKIFICICLFITFNAIVANAQNSQNALKIEKNIKAFFDRYKFKEKDLQHSTSVVECNIDENKQTIKVIVDEYFAEQDFNESLVDKIYSKLRKELFKPYKKYNLQIFTNGMKIEDLIPDRLSEDVGKSRLWGDLEYHDAPWTMNISKPNQISHGLQGRHISLWASHGRYYDNKSMVWKWQRPNLFGTTEDLFTQTIVIPYLIPMLEHAGAVVFTPRERDWQKQEIIVDNDSPTSMSYLEINNSKRWTSTPIKGFAFRQTLYNNEDNPFEAGTAKMIPTTSSKKSCSQIYYKPKFPEDGRYAVYVSYQTVDKSVSDAQYIVFHKGQRTDFRVNQKMGGGTWVYLGTFDFDKGCNEYNCVVITNNSKSRGIVTADAVRFGGGMGNIQRGGNVSGLPRALEGARYYAQWAGAPYSVYCSKKGEDDYAEDINTRSLMTNWLAGGSVYMPSMSGKNVPIELSLAIHSDAGYSANYKSLIGSLAICTTNFNDGKLNSGISRMASHDFANALLNGVYTDLKFQYKNWNKRELFDKNYSETRMPEIPSAILETMSHQNFPDMIYGQDPNFRFTLARSIYKTILKFIADQHGRPFVVEPLVPYNFNITFVSKNKVKLNWSPRYDTQEPTSKPTSYIVYTATGTSGFDNGIISKKNSYTLELEPGILYNFKVAAINRGGESFPTEVLSAYYNPSALKTVLIVNGFHRLSAPSIRNTEEEQGFDLDADIGLSYGTTAGWNGRQICFDKSKIGIEGPGGLGYCGDELAGTFIAGNEFNYVTSHAEAIQSVKRYNILSCSSEAVETGIIDMNKYNCVDLLLGLEKFDVNALKYYKTFTTMMQRKLSEYVRHNGRLFVSGSYIGSDMKESTEKNFIAKTLKFNYTDSEHAYTNDTIHGMGLSFDIYRSLNEQHYAATNTDIIKPLTPAYCFMQYADGNDACVAYSGRDYRCISMGFPFECIKSAKMRKSVMSGALKFLME
jgi:hypothetical protein